MSATKADIIAQLQKELLPLQGYKPSVGGASLDPGLGAINNAFPNNTFPLGAVHEFCCARAEDVAVTGGFISGILASLMRSGRASLWISRSKTIFPPALKAFGIEPDKIIFINLQKERDILWAMEEALECDGLAAVVGEMQDIGFTASRRLQLAVEQSRVTGFIIRPNPRQVITTACVSRWKITSIPSIMEAGMPGVGFPRWNVELLKVRNGKPGTWQIEWIAGKFRHVIKVASIEQEQQKKTG
ncbi:MAG: Error-prone repair protein ImuA [Chitinophagaceae bacterium]|nr:Error-prone repair protein ImuA [Chitinophagaceae bacterium]